jgi:hypothetical protein
MATNNFNSDPTNDSFEPLMSYFDSQGVNRLESANISSYGFDGFIPTVIQNRTASGILPGMTISLTGSSTGQNFYKVLSNNAGDREFTASPSNEIIIEYLDNDQLVQVLSASVNDIFSVSYENWDGKDLGTTGWYLGNSGNAIFSNVAVRGRVDATSGKVEELTIGSNYYPIADIQGVDIQSSSVTGNKGQFVMSTNTNRKRLYPQDIVQVSGISASGWTYTGGIPTTASTLFIYKNKIKVLTASYDGGTYKYHCELVQSGVITDYNLGSMTGKSGSFTFGDMFFGDYQTYGLSTPDIIEGFVFDQVGEGGTWDDYIPDFIDISGRFRLGGGKITFDSSTLNVTGNIYALGGEISGDLAIVDGGQIYVGNNKNSGQRINIRHTDLTGYTELGFPVFSLSTGSATSASPLIQSGGFDDLVAGQDPDPPWGVFWGFVPWTTNGHTAVVDSTVYKDGGQSLRVYSSSVTGAQSAVSQNINSLIPGEEYTISAWVFANRDLSLSGDDYVDIWLLSSSTTAGSRPEYFTSDVRIASLLGATAVASGVWTKLSNKFVVPPAPYAYHRLDLRTKSDQNTSVWWDTVEISKTKTTSKISGFFFNDGEMFAENISVISDGTITIGNISQNASIGSNPDPTNVPNILKMSGTDIDYRLWIGHLDPVKAGFTVSKTGHMKVGTITSSATYARTTSTAYVGIDASGNFSRYSSSQNIKDNIISIRNELGASVDRNKIISESPTINYRKILELSPVEYDKIDEPGYKKFGFIAEDVADKLPEIATYDNNQNPVYFDMAGLIAATVAIVQEQQEKIEELNSRVLQLESQLGG